MPDDTTSASTSVELRFHSTSAKLQTIVYSGVGGTPQEASPKEGKAARALGTVLVMFRRHKNPSLFRVTFVKNSGKKAKQRTGNNCESSIPRLILSAKNDTGRDRGQIYQLQGFLSLFVGDASDGTSVDVDVSKLKPDQVKIIWDGSECVDPNSLEKLAQTIASKHSWELADYEWKVVEKHQPVDLNVSEASRPRGPMFKQGHWLRPEVGKLQERLNHRRTENEDRISPIQDFRKVWPDGLIIGDVILECGISGYAGVPPSHVRIKMSPAPEKLPAWIERARRTICEPVPNKGKVILRGMELPIADCGGILTLELSTSDYWLSRAVQQAAAELHPKILDRSIRLFDIPRRLDCPIVIITSDDKFLMAKRVSNVAYCPDTWDISIGESIDCDDDKDLEGNVIPLKTVHRAMHEELGLPFDICEKAEIKFVAMITEWRFLLSNIVSVVRLHDTSRTISDLLHGRRCHEHEIHDWIEFSPEQCSNLIISGRHAPMGDLQLDSKINNCSCASLLAAAFSEFGCARVMACI